ncbi:ubiquitin-like modifier-activating enzyme 1 [Zophobas morio]|uniref:ubiquitin-like modifier-activating enzyme 1 n=1 Tax=Zophobas morio TaxID=2755281 RepID=UPI0030837534
MEPASSEIREDVYSRQLYAYGAEAMKNMAGANVLFIGLAALGVEIAKNVVLSGVKTCVFYDNNLVQKRDLSSHFFLTVEDIGKKRAHVVTPRLQELNSLVACSFYEDDLTVELISRFSVVVCTNLSFQDQLCINEMTRIIGLPFISARTAGLFGYLFNDFGPKFEVFDTNGEECAAQMIASINDEGTVTCLEDKRHGLETGDYVTFSEIEGMTELNNCPPIKVKVTGPYTFEIGDTSSYSKYVRGGLVQQVKMPKIFEFKSLREQLREPRILPFDFSKLDNPIQMHLGFLALDLFSVRQGHLPRPYNSRDLSIFFKFVDEVKSEAHGDIKISKKYLSNLCYQASGDLPPMQSVLGGFAAQEVMKATSKKFTPLQQFFYFDSLESMPPDAQLNEEDCIPADSRYDGQFAVFGQNYHCKLRNLKTFLVGSGAIGCEILKNWALCGIGSSDIGSINVTDMDTIEKSNLNRQFLFRDSNVSQPKSLVASQAVKHMNGAINIQAYQDRVGEETENVFDDDFFEQLDVVVNALDNVEARRYVDCRCVFYCKPLLESGTLGTKGNTQVVIPYLTESYSSSQDPPEKSIPMCTLKNFPYAIEHTIQWARESFEGLFMRDPETVNQYIDNDTFLGQLQKQPDSTQKEALDIIQKSLVYERPRNFADCVSWARLLFQEYYFNKIAQLLYNFPKDSLTSSGLPFWSYPKRCPTPILFDMNKSLHLSFIVAAANLRAALYGIPSCRDLNFIKCALTETHLPEFKPKSNVRIQVSENESIEPESADLEELRRLYSSLPLRDSSLKLTPLYFEKDDDNNFHVDYITACSNLRATAYNIAHADRLKTKGIAGKIIPAVATTTSMIAGLVCLELYKVAFENRKLDSYKCGFINLALPLVTFSEPIAAPKAKYNGKEFTLWDRIEIYGEILIKDLIKKLEEEHQINVMIISCGVSMLYAVFMPKEKRKERYETTVEKLYVSTTHMPIPPHVKSLTIEVLCTDKDGEDVEFPFVRYYLKK